MLPYCRTNLIWELFKNPKAVGILCIISGIVSIAAMIGMAVRDCNWLAISSLASFALMAVCAWCNKGCRSNFLTIAVLVLFVAGIATMFIALALV